MYLSILNSETIGKNLLQQYIEKSKTLYLDGGSSIKKKNWKNKI